MPASPYWQARNARARALGYENYYDYRAHDYGKMAPTAPRATGEVLRRLRGHAGPADARRALRNAELVIVNPGGKRDKEGHYTRADVSITDSQGVQRDYSMDLDSEEWDDFADEVDDSDADVLDAYALLGGE